MRRSSGQIVLRAGLRPVTPTYFQADGPMALGLYVERPRPRRRRVAASWQVHERTSGDIRVTKNAPDAR